MKSAVYKHTLFDLNFDFSLAQLISIPYYMV